MNLCLVAICTFIASAFAVPQGRDEVCIKQTLSSNKYAYFQSVVNGARRITSMQLIKKISRSDCTYRVSYGFIGVNVWVNKGCRAEFEICYLPVPEIVDAVCTDKTLSSNKYAYFQSEVAEARRIISMQLITKFSRSDCTYRVSYGFTGVNVWVDKGCRANFEICYLPAPKIVDPVCSNETLSSNNYAYSQSVVNGARIITSMQLIKKISRSDCTYTESYGFIGVDAWVHRGCRAIFEICYLPGVSKAVDCSSNDYKQDACLANVGYVDIVYPITHHSKSPCIFNFSYGRDGNQIWVDKGCRATFRVTG